MILNPCDDKDNLFFCSTLIVFSMNLGNDNKSPVVGNDTNDGTKLSEDAESTDDGDDAMSDTDEEDVAIANDEPLSEASAIMRFF